MNRVFVFVAGKTLALASGVLFATIAGICIASEYVSAKKWELENGRRA